MAGVVVGAICLASSAPAVAQTCPDEIEGPTAAFGYTPSAPTAGSNVSFDASSSSGGLIHDSVWSHADQSCAYAGSNPDDIDSYRWDFGDGTAPVTSSSPTTTHSFAAPGTYTVTLTVDTSVTGSDSESQAVGVTARITVTKSGLGTVTSGEDPRQIDCGSVCAGTYAAGSNVRLTATPAPGYRFIGWFGGCSGTSLTCDLSNIAANTAVHASFHNPPPAVAFLQPTGQWLRGPFTTQVALTDDSTIAPAVRIDLYQRNALGAYVATDLNSTSHVNDEAFATLFPSASHPDHVQGLEIRVETCDTLGACGTVTRRYGIDRAQPTITEASDGPAAVVGPGTQLLRFSTADLTSGVASRTCRLDNGPSQPCAVSGIANQWKMESTHTTSGPHTWTIEVRDNAGWLRTLTRSFTVDADPPETAITAGPADGSSSTATTAEFAFGTTPPETGATYRCRIFSVTTAPAVFGDCSGPGASHTTSGLPPGTYRFEVAARDAVGNTDPTPVGRTFTVTAPVTDGGGGSTGGDTGSTGGSTGSTGDSTTGSSIGTSVGTTATTPTDSTAQTSGQQNVTPPPAKKPGKCAKLKGKKRAACIRRACGKLNKKKTIKKYRACVKKVTFRGSAAASR